MKHSYIFQELITAGDLFSYVQYHKAYFGREVLSEAPAAVITKQIVEAVRFLHEKDIVHRDLKPDNILVASLSYGSRIVLTDFGGAVNLSEYHTRKRLKRKRLTRLHTRIGTEDYWAP